MFSVGDTVIALERITYYGVPRAVVGRQGVVIRTANYSPVDFHILVRFKAFYPLKNESVDWWTNEDGIELLYDANEVM